MPRIILASGSPRRQALLRCFLDRFETTPSRIVEPPFHAGEVGEYVQNLARAKAGHVAEALQEGLVIAADTVVVVDEVVLGKPRDDLEAKAMLSRLSGKWHRVLTGLCLILTPSREVLGLAETRVKFASLTDREIDWYVGTGEPKDKAGAYAIQGRGALLIEGIEGDYFNVMGLPLRLLYRLAGDLGVDLKKGHFSHG